MREDEVFRKRKAGLIVASILLLGLASVGCIPAPSAPIRHFTTADLLIDISLLPKGWEVNGSASVELDSGGLSFRNNLGGSEGDFRNASTPADASHEVVRFRNTQDAAQAYQDHVHTSNTYGQYGETWTPMIGFTYQSSVAKQFRVMCVTVRNSPNIARACVIEAQYDEFVSTVVYSTLNPEWALGDLEMLAKAVDVRFAHYLDEGIIK